MTKFIAAGFGSGHSARRRAISRGARTESSHYYAGCDRIIVRLIIGVALGLALRGI